MFVSCLKNLIYAASAYSGTICGRGAKSKIAFEDTVLRAACGRCDRRVRSSYVTPLKHKESSATDTSNSRSSSRRASKSAAAESPLLNALNLEMHAAC